jgi:hypothetical protein
MDRLCGRGYRESIAAAWSIIPARLHDLIQTDWFCGADPVFADLHRFEEASYGRSYRSVSHCVHEHNQTHRPRAARSTTVVLAAAEPPRTVVHELGHVLHARLDWQHVPRPVSWYAETNWYEAFAEAFTSWLIPGYAAHPDAAFLHLMEELAGTA